MPSCESKPLVSTMRPGLAGSGTLNSLPSVSTPSTSIRSSWTPAASSSGLTIRGSGDPVLERVVGTILRYNMLHRGHRVGVAVSGGIDSVSLLQVLREIAGRLDLSLAVLHLNHKLR